MSYGIGTIFLFLRPLEAKAKALSIVSYLARKPDLQQKNSRCSPMSNLKKPTHTAVRTLAKKRHSNEVGQFQSCGTPRQSQIVWPTNATANCTATAASVVRCRATAFGSSEAPRKLPEAPPNPNLNLIL